MDHLVSYSQKDCNSNNPLNKKMEFWTDINEESAKYRDIPVFQTLDDLKSTDIYCENVSGVKERKKMSNKLKGDNYHTKSTSILDAKAITKKRTKLDPVIPVNALQFKHYPDHSFLDRMGQGSVSEPNLFNAKDRGDSINLQDFYRDDNLLSDRYFGHGKTKISKDRGVRGCIYVKSGGKVYKSTIETRNLQAVQDTSFNPLGTKHGKCGISLPLGDSAPWNKLESRYKTSGTNERQGPKEGIDDFEIAIFLSGVRNIPEKNQKKQRKLADNRKKEVETKLKQEKKGKKKKKNVQRNETTLVLGRSFKVGSKSFHAPSKMLTINPYDSSKPFANESERVGKSRIQLMFSSESENEYVFEIPDKTPNSVRRLGNVSENNPNLRAITSKENENKDIRFSFKSKKNEIACYRPGGTPYSSFYPFSDVYRSPQKKVCDKELWHKFETIFRSYASTTRHSGEVIPRKISTEWMTNYGVVDEIMTEKEADDAFRQAAGTKITMNAQEYKEFLIMLTLRMKLPYYEIYRRMCGI